MGLGKERDVLNMHKLLRRSGIWLATGWVTQWKKSRWLLVAALFPGSSSPLHTRYHPWTLETRATTNCCSSTSTKTLVVSRLAPRQVTGFTTVSHMANATQNVSFIFHSSPFHSIDNASFNLVTASGGTGIVEMLFCTSLVAHVGAGDELNISPRHLHIINTKVSTLFLCIYPHLLTCLF